MRTFLSYTTIPVGTYFGVPLKINATIFAVMALLYFTTPTVKTEDGVTLEYVNLIATVMYPIMLSFVVLHEYGHCIMAKKLGWKVRDICMYPIGGIATMEFKHDRPIGELLVIIAGPLVNLCFAIIFAVANCLAFFIPMGGSDMTTFKIILFAVLTILTLINCILFCFNLLPIFPMDGGRILRALLSFKLGHYAATWWAVKIGQVLGFLFVCFMAYMGYFFAVIVLSFVLFKSQSEITHAGILMHLYNIRRKMAEIINKPELETANLKVLMEELTALEDSEQKRQLESEELLPLLELFHEEGISI